LHGNTIALFSWHIFRTVLSDYNQGVEKEKRERIKFYIYKTRDTPRVPMKTEIGRCWQYSRNWVRIAGSSGIVLLGGLPGTDVAIGVVV